MGTVIPLGTLNILGPYDIDNVTTEVLGAIGPPYINLIANAPAGSHVFITGEFAAGEGTSPPVAAMSSSGAVLLGFGLLATAGAMRWTSLYAKQGRGMR